MNALRSPETGAVLLPDTPHSLAAAGERWPSVDGIAYLRTGRSDLVRETLARLDGGDTSRATALLLADQDDWWDGPAPPEADLLALVADRDRLTLREAMARLAYGRVGDYFAHRWTDPTFLAGLALMEAHWNAPRQAFELACGIGHYGRELASRGVAYSGADVVFSKLWLARHFVVGSDASLVCFDAASPWPIGDSGFDLVLCQDAFYFLEPKPAVLDRLRGLLAPDGVLAVGHVHNRDAPNHSAGRAVTAGELERLFPDAVAYDDDELTRALAEGRAPRPDAPARLRSAEAFAVVDGPGLTRSPRPVVGGLALPAPQAPLRRNPLYGEQAEIVWPSERYRSEYASRATYPARAAASADQPWAAPAAIRRRELVALPERW